MRIIKYIFCAMLFVGVAKADTINIDWMDGDTTYAQTTCTVGDDLILPTTPTRRGYTFAGWSIAKVFSDGVELPAEYDRLEYIESTGTQYIDTGIRVNSNNLTYDWVAAETKSTSGTTLFSVQATSAPWSGTLYGRSTDLRTVYVGNTNNRNIGYENVVGRGKIHWVLDIKDNHTVSLYRNGNLTGTLEWAGNTNNKTSLHLFNSNTSQNGNTEYTNGWQLEKFIFIDDGKTILYLISAKRNSDNKLGMFDLITGQFFTNQGTGEFIAGPVVYE